MTHHPLLASRLAVSTVPPRTTSFMPSIMEEPPLPPTSRSRSQLRPASIALREPRLLGLELQPPFSTPGVGAGRRSAYCRVQC